MQKIDEKRLDLPIYKSISHTELNNFRLSGGFRLLDNSEWYRFILFFRTNKLNIMIFVSEVDFKIDISAIKQYIRIRP